MHGHHADLIVLALDHDRLEAAALSDQLRHVGEDLHLRSLEGQGVDSGGGEHHELREIHGVGAFAKDLALRSALAARAKEGSRVTEIDRSRGAPQGLGRRQGHSVPREDVTDLALGNGDQRNRVHAVLQRHHEVHATAQHTGLIARLPSARDQACGNRPAPAPKFLRHTHAPVRDVADSPGEPAEKEDRCDCGHGEPEGA